MHGHTEIHLDISREMRGCAQIHIQLHILTHTGMCVYTHRHTHRVHTGMFVYTHTHTESRCLNASLGTHHYRFSCSVRSHELLTLKARLG